MPAMMKSDDEVDCAVGDGVDQAVPGQLDGDGLAVKALADLLGNLDVEAVGVLAVHVGDGDSVFGLLVGLPVVGSVGSLHAHTQRGLVGRGASRAGSRAGGRGGAAAAAGREQRDTANGENGEARSLEETTTSQHTDLRLLIR